MALTTRLRVGIAFALAAQPCFAWEECDFVGLALPLLYYHGETEWPAFLRLVLYLMGLFWLFLAVGMISDIFMGGIERVTSWRKRVDKPIPDTNPVQYKKETIYIWNATIANLTLMALGSSAPEILLSVIEITAGDFLLGDLGAGTIVGSAAFNLLIISAVCVAALPDGEIRKIKQVPVYVITATFSVFAYLWLLAIVLIITPQVVTAVEALVTLIFLPVLLVLAFMADKGYITFGFVEKEEDKNEEKTISPDVTKEELAEIHKKIKEKHGNNLTLEQITNIMQIEYLERRNKAYYRRRAGKAAKEIKKDGVEQAKDTEDDATNEKKQRAIYIGVEHQHYCFLESIPKATIKVVRDGPKDVKVSVKYLTKEDTAKKGTDFKEISGTLIFERGEVEKTVEVELINDSAYEEDEDFFLALEEPKILDDSGHTSAALEALLMEDLDKARITIIDDDLPGKLKFGKDEFEAFENANEDHEFLIQVERFDGGSGTITCKYETEAMTAVPGVDYHETSGTLTFEENVMKQNIPVVIKHSGRYSKNSSFTVTLTDPTGGAAFRKDSDGGAEKEIAHVVIKGYQSETRDLILTKMKSRVIASTTANQAYAQQFRDALFKVKDDDDDEDDGDGEGEEDPLKEQGGEKPSAMDWFFHIISLPWKLMFAFVPPPQYLGGWATFVGALCMIAVITALIGDMANLVGCCMGIHPEITAITFVALGTSLPDTFASKTAAEQDPYADNSIGNVTGSNSVNVFIGLGLSWSIAAIYWQIQTPNEKWLEKFYSYEPKVQDAIKDVMGLSPSDSIIDSGVNAVFMVRSGTLWFNLMVFSFNAFFAIQHLAARRAKWGGELGGPKKGMFGQYFSAVFLISQWFVYVIASTIFVYRCEIFGCSA